MGTENGMEMVVRAGGLGGRFAGLCRYLPSAFKGEHPKQRTWQCCCHLVQNESCRTCLHFFRCSPLLLVPPSATCCEMRCVVITSRASSHVSTSNPIPLHLPNFNFLDSQCSEQLKLLQFHASEAELVAKQS